MDIVFIWLKDLLRHLHELSVASALFTFAISYVHLVRSRTEPRLDDLIARSLAGSTIPTGILLLASAFMPAVISQLQGVNIYIAVAGLALLFVAFKRVFAPQVTV